ncbi:MAG: DMT family transporter [Holosporaceae bacterium]|jgi:drug/metabolite transporter (DMT)-like permease|nr:DMT family transporter [Holosporaceae bacterium]
MHNKLSKLSKLSFPKTGYLFAIAGVFLYSFSDAIMKYFIPIYGVNQITFLRTICRFLPLLCFSAYAKINPLKTSRVGENILRSVLASIGTYAFLLAYKHSAMVDVIVIGYTTSIFVIPMSVLLLHEKLHRRDALAIAIGFAGVLLAFRPGYGIFQSGIMFAVIGAIIAAMNQVIIKRLSSTDSEVTIIFYHHISLILMSLFFGGGEFIAMDEVDLAYIAVGGIIGTIAQYCMVHAFKLSTSSNVASATYFMLIPATILDFFVYGKIPDMYIVAGLILILTGIIHCAKAKAADPRVPSRTP